MIMGFHIRVAVRLRHFFYTNTFAILTQFTPYHRAPTLTSFPTFSTAQNRVVKHGYQTNGRHSTHSSPVQVHPCGQPVLARQAENKAGVQFWFECLLWLSIQSCCYSSRFTPNVILELWSCCSDSIPVQSVKTWRFVIISIEFQPRVYRAQPHQRVSHRLSSLSW